MIIRYGTPDDAPTLSAFAARTFQEAFAAENDPDDMAAYMATAFTPDQQRIELADPANICLIASKGDDILGYTLIRTATEIPACVSGRPAIELSRFYVDRPWHGTAVAAALMDETLREGVSLGAHTIWLGVWEHNVRAVRFYTKHGFRDAGSHFFVLGSDVQTDRVMVRELVG